MKEETMTTTDLTLDERAAKVLGYVSHTCTECGAWGCSQYHKGRMLLPPYSTSIDAQHPLEEMARARGWELHSGVFRYDLPEGGEYDGYHAWVERGHFFPEPSTYQMREAEAPTEPEARLACLLKVLEETK